MHKIGFIRVGVFVLLSLLCFGCTYAQHKIPFVTLYWGQDVNGKEPSLAVVCQQYQAQHINIGFLNNFPTNGKDDLPGLSLANDHCNETFPGVDLLTCPDVGDDIKVCQDLGVTVSLSIGGGGGGNFGFSSASEATTFASTLTDLFLGGNSTTRPFGNVVLDGVDLDIEGGPAGYYDVLINELIALNGEDLIISGAPGCDFPDVWMGPVLNSTARDHVDYLFIQFYGNPTCDLKSKTFNINSWFGASSDNTYIHIGLPATPKAADSKYGGYVDSSVLLNQIARIEQGSWASRFGGVMFWDASWNTESNYSIEANQLLVPLQATSSAAAAVSSAASSLSSSPSTSSSLTLLSAPHVMLPIFALLLFILL